MSPSTSHPCAANRPGRRRVHGQPGCGLYSVPTPDAVPCTATQLALHQPGCRPGGCAGLCSAETLAVVHRVHRGALLNHARAILGDAGQAEEVVQETFVRAWQKCSGFDPHGTPVLAWLTVVLRNLALDRVRARACRPAVAWTPEPDAPDAGPAQPDGTELVLLRARLRAALATLHDDHRATVLKTVVLDRPYDEVAAELGIPVGTVKSRTHYALRRLRGVLEADGVARPA